jgi:hypothetical protein
MWGRLQRSCTLVGSFSLLAVLTACRSERSAEICRPEQYGFEEWTVHRELLQQAASRADAILDPALKSRLETTSRTPGPGEEAVPVFQVHGAFVSDGDVALIAGGRCLFVNPDWQGQLSPFFGKNTPGTLDLEPADALAIILLHEVGHIQKGGLPQSPPIDTLLASLGPGKQEEMRADAFAAGQIAAAFKRKWDRGMAAFRLTQALSQISWNLQAHRMLNNFGATSLRLSKVFSETGYSHPNLELRFLVINYLVNPSKLQLDLLTSFLDASMHPGGILYQRNGSNPYSLFPQQTRQH